MPCIHCGAKNAEDAVFCGNCGKQIKRRNPAESTLLSPLPVHDVMGQSSKTRNLLRNLLWFLAGNIVAIAVLALIFVLLLQARSDDLHYGNPRTFQTDAVVGHGGDSAEHPSHFIALNLKGQVIIVEMRAGNPANTINYTGPHFYETQGDLIPITLEFRDVNNDGKPDMLIHFQDKVLVFLNDGTQFIPPR